jgi:hypothetical protein
MAFRRGIHGRRCESRLLRMAGCWAEPGHGNRESEGGNRNGKA